MHHANADEAVFSVGYRWNAIVTHEKTEAVYGKNT
jgi:hypothetical protein